MLKTNQELENKINEFWRRKKAQYPDLPETTE